MAFYNYKRVTNREDYHQARQELEEIEGQEFEGTVDYDGDAWIIVEFLLNKLQNQIKQLQGE